MRLRTASLCRRLVARFLIVAHLLVIVPVTPNLAAAAERVLFYHDDALGSPVAMTDASGSVVWRADYEPFGAVAAETGTVGNTHQFTGKERDPETGLQYFGARFYDGGIGRFLSVDPAYVLQENLVDPQRWNKYAYARNNPLRYNDPDGRLIDVIVDAGFIAYDLIDIGVTRFTGGEVTGTQKAALGADLAAAAIPFVTGAGIAVRVGARAEHALETARAGEALVTANRAAGKAAEAKVAGELVAEGQKILGKQVCCRTSLGRRVSDHVVQDAAGNINAIEVKSGNATRSAVQRKKDAEIAAGRGTFVGKNAPKELRGQQRAVETVERKPKD